MLRWFKRVNTVLPELKFEITDIQVKGGLANTLVIARNATYFSAYNELFIDIKETQFDRNRLYAGLGFSINESIRVESGYMIQTQKNISRGQLQLIVYNNLPFKNNK
jgi:hypothetical protein